MLFRSNVSQWGWSAAEWCRPGFRYLDLLHPADRELTQADVLAHRLAGNAHYVQQYRLRTAAGQWVWIEDRTWIEYDAQGEIVCANAVLLDCSARHRALQVAALERNTLDRLLAGALALPALLEQLALDYQNLLPERLFSVLLLDSKSGTLLDCAGPDLPPIYRAAIHGSPIGPAAGSCGTAAHSGQTVIVSDISSDPLWANYKRLALAHGLAACWSVPIKGAQGRVLGTFAVYARQIAQPSPGELALLERGAYLAGLDRKSVV